MSSTPSTAPTATPPPPRKFPAPCWNQEESLALINCYWEKWYSLHRRNLRTADWEAVAEEVNRRCPSQYLVKTSAQCQHKMEKLRKRYRTEKQRIMSRSRNGNGRFFGSSWVLFDLIDSMEIGSADVHNNNNNHDHIPQISNLDLDVKPFHMNHMNMNPNTSDCNDRKCEVMLSKSQNHEFGERSRDAAHHIKLDHHYNRDNYDYSGEVHFNNDFDAPPPGGFKRKSSNYNGNVDGFKRKSSNYNECDDVFLVRKDSGARPRERERVSMVGEMATSIKMLGEGLIKMEKMKIEMLRDVEKMRTEMEMKRSEMILEAQHLTVTAFVEGLKKKEEVKVSRID